MTPALRSRLEAERMFTAKDIGEIAFEAYKAGFLDKSVNCLSAAEAARDIATDAACEKVRQHLSSDTTRIRPKRQA